MGENNFEISQKESLREALDALDKLDKHEIHSALLEGLSVYVDGEMGRSSKLDPQELEGYKSKEEALYKLSCDFLVSRLGDYAKGVLIKNAEESDLSPYTREFLKSILETGYSDVDFDEKGASEDLTNYYFAIRGLELM